jgi:hypothetical protein
MGTDFMLGSQNKFILDNTFYLENCTDKFPLFFQPYWLKSVTLQWKAISLVNSSNQLIGAYIYCYNDNRVYMPSFTPFLGPWLLEQCSNKEVFSLLEKATEELSKFKFIEQKWSPKYINWLPFYWKNYNQSTRFTQVIKYNPDVKEMIALYKNNVKRDIKYVTKKLVIKEFIDISLLYQMIFKSFKRRALPPPVSLEELESFLTKLKQHNCFFLLGAFSEGNQLVSAGLYVYDKMRCYYLMGGYDDIAPSGGMSYVIHHAILYSQEKKLDFDFEGSMIMGINNFFSSFGAELVPYNYINKYDYTKVEKIKILLKEILHG